MHIWVEEEKTVFYLMCNCRTFPIHVYTLVSKVSLTFFLENFPFAPWWTFFWVWRQIATVTNTSFQKSTRLTTDAFAHPPPPSYQYWDLQEWTLFKYLNWIFKKKVIDNIQLFKWKIQEKGYYYKFAITKLYAYLLVYNFFVEA